MSGNEKMLPNLRDYGTMREKHVENVKEYFLLF